MKNRMNKAIFLDKDGTLIENDPYNVDPARVVFYPEVREALRLFAGWGYRLVIVSNQAGVARGLFAERDLRKLEIALRNSLREMGARLGGFYYCPHDPQGSVREYAVGCECRKPQPGLLVQAAQELHIDLENSWMIGDILDDIEAGRRAGCHTVLLDRGNETEWRFSELRQPDMIVKDMREAAERISRWHPREVA